MSKILSLSTAAAALLFVAGAASAQDLKKNESPAPAPAAQQNAPAEKVAPSMHAGDRKLPETTGQSTDMDKTKSPDKNAMEKSSGGNENAEVKSNGKAATTGQGAAAGAAKLSTEQRTRITTIIKEQKVEPAHLNVSIAIGTRVPAGVHLYPVPVEVVNINPEWSGFDYIMVGGEIIIIDPHSHAIVAIIEA